MWCLTFGGLYIYANGLGQVHRTCGGVECVCKRSTIPLNTESGLIPQHKKKLIKSFENGSIHNKEVKQNI